MSIESVNGYWKLRRSIKLFDAYVDGALSVLVRNDSRFAKDGRYPSLAAEPASVGRRERLSAAANRYVALLEQAREDAMAKAHEQTATDVAQTITLIRLYADACIKVVHFAEANAIADSEESRDHE